MRTASGGWRYSDAAYNERWVKSAMRNITFDANNCWIWNGGSHPRFGYGQKAYRGKTNRVHRKIYEIMNGVSLTKKQYVCHRCDNPKCCNPAHLFVGTQFDNMADSVRKGRHAEQLVTHCPKGHEYDSENTYIYTKPDGRKARDCKACQRARNRIKGGWPEDLAYSTPTVPPGRRPVNAKGYAKRNAV